mmetsp:Transcript_162/g.395  ORF Transcript_162/g.395 Transcript_162/m.395 type:complete len:151 (-) Transcript_162:395-847(-)
MEESHQRSSRTLKRMECRSEIGDTPAYHLDRPPFRHKGDSNAALKSSFIKKPTLNDDEKEGVFAYYSDSGTEKTVELAASSHTRDALFTIIEAGRQAATQMLSKPSLMIMWHSASSWRMASRNVSCANSSMRCTPSSASLPRRKRHRPRS